MLSGVLIALLAMFVWGASSALLTKDSYRFSSEYPGYGKEVMLTSFNHGRVKIQFIAKSSDNAIVISKQFFGFFMRLGSHYFLFASEQDGAEKQQRFTVRSYFIESAGDNDALLISDQRGVFVTKDGTLIHLNSVLTGHHQLNK